MLNLGSRSFTKQSRDNHLKINNNKKSPVINSTRLENFWRKASDAMKKENKEKKIGGKAMIGCAYEGCPQHCHCY